MTLGRRWSVWGLPIVIAAALVLWALFSMLALPGMVARAYAGEGLSWLAAQMGGRGDIPLDTYLADFAAMALRVTLMLVLFLALSVGYAARGLTATQPWLEPAPLRNLAIARVVVVGLQLVLLLWPGAHGANIAADPGYQALLAASPGDTYEPLAMLRLMLPGVERPGASLLTAIWWIAVAGGLAGLIGLGGRVPLLLLAWGSTALVAHAYSYGEYHHPEALHTIALWLVALTPSTRALSVDRFVRRLRANRRSGGFRPVTELERSPHARWPLALLGVLFAITYFDAAIEKSIIGGRAWFDAETLAYHLAVDGTRRLKSLAVWLAQNPDLARPLAIGTWGIEFFFPLAIIAPVVAPVLVVAAMGMHLGIWIIQGPPFLQAIVLLPLPFQPGLRSVWRRFRGEPSPLRVLYDGQCDLCMRSMTGLETLDPSRRLRFVDLENPDEAGEVPEVDRPDALSWMHVADDEGRVWRGFGAVRRLARALPPLWPTLPILYAPFSGVVGPRVYDTVARRRSRRGCRIDLGPPP